MSDEKKNVTVKVQDSSAEAIGNALANALKGVKEVSEIKELVKLMGAVEAAQEDGKLAEEHAELQEKYDNLQKQQKVQAKRVSRIYNLVSAVRYNTPADDDEDDD